MLSRGHYLNEVAEDKRHRQTLHHSETVLNETAIGSVNSKPVIANTDAGTDHPFRRCDLMLEWLPAADFARRISSRWRYESFGQAGPTSRAHGGIGTGRSHAGNTQFYHDITHHDKGVFTTKQRRFIIFYY